MAVPAAVSTKKEAAAAAASLIVRIDAPLLQRAMRNSPALPVPLCPAYQAWPPGPTTASSGAQQVAGPSGTGQRQPPAIASTAGQPPLTRDARRDRASPGLDR